MRVRTVSSDIFCRLWKQYLQNGFGFCRPVLCIYQLWDTTTTLRISQWLMPKTAFSTSRQKLPPNLRPTSNGHQNLGKGSPRQGYDLCQVWTSRSDYSGGYGLPWNPAAPIQPFERLQHTCDYVIDPPKVLDGKGMYKSPWVLSCMLCISCAWNFRPVPLSVQVAEKGMWVISDHLYVIYNWKLITTPRPWNMVFRPHVLWVDSCSGK